MTETITGAENRPVPAQSTLHGAAAGTIAGAAAGLVFAIVHNLMISPIWFSLPLLLIAGALCGLCLGGTFGLLLAAPTLGDWLRYNALFDSLFVLIALASKLIYEPVIDLAEILAGGPPAFMWAKTVPLTIVAVLLMTGLVFRLYGRTVTQLIAILTTCAILVLLLGLNISLMGLVYVPVSAYYMIAETFGLIFALNLAYVTVFAGLQWRRLDRRLSPSVKPGNSAVAFDEV